MKNSHNDDDMKEGSDSTGSGIDPMLFVRYLENSLDKDELEQFLAYLDNHPEDLETLVDLINIEEHPFTEDEIREVRERMSLTPKEQVELILAYQDSAGTPDAPPLPTPDKVKLPDSVYPRVRSWLFPQGRIRLARLIPLLCILLLPGAFAAWKYHQTNYQLTSARSLLAAMHHEYLEEARLSGDYRAGSTGRNGTTRGLTGNRPSYLDDALAHVKTAVSSGKNDLESQALLTRIYIMKNDTVHIDSMLAVVGDEIYESPELQNDVGAYYARSDNWDRAAILFEGALALKADLRAAQFNLGLARMEQGRIEEGMKIFKAYQAVEPNSAWKTAAGVIMMKYQSRPESDRLQ